MKRPHVDAPIAVVSSDSGQDSGYLVNPFMRVINQMTKQLATIRVTVTPAVFPRLFNFHHIDIQSTGQKSDCVNTI